MERPGDNDKLEKGQKGELFMITHALFLTIWQVEGGSTHINWKNKEKKSVLENCRDGGQSVQTCQKMNNF